MMDKSLKGSWGLLAFRLFRKLFRELLKSFQYDMCCLTGNLSA